MSAGLLDTSVVIGGMTADAAARVTDGVAISVMTLGELHASVLLASDAPTRAARLARLADVQRELVVLDIDAPVAQAFGALRARSGRGAVADLLIAATAEVHGLLLVTRDVRQATLLGPAALLVV